MKKLTLTICLTLAVLLGSLGADFQKEPAAARTGDYATALREWRPLAEQGYTDAQFNLGQMCRRGIASDFMLPQ